MVIARNGYDTYLLDNLARQPNVTTISLSKECIDSSNVPLLDAIVHQTQYKRIHLQKDLYKYINVAFQDKNSYWNYNRASLIEQNLNGQFVDFFTNIQYDWEKRGYMQINCHNEQDFLSSISHTLIWQ